MLSDSHILNTILFTPLVGAILMLFIPRERPDLHRWIGNIFACLGLLVSLPLIWRFTPLSTRRASSSSPTTNGSPRSAPATRSASTASASCWSCSPPSSARLPSSSSWSAIQKREKEYYILLLLLQTGMLGVFMSLDFVSFTFSGK